MIEVYEPSLKEMIFTGSPLKQIKSGFSFTEGPLWDSDTKVLLFSDIPANRIYVYAPDTGYITTYRQPSNFSNGLAFDQHKDLLVCEHSTRRVTRIQDSYVEVLADSYQGQRLNSPNDLIVTADGSVLFTDPVYGLREGLGGPGEINRVLYVNDTVNMHIRSFEITDDWSLSGGEVILTMEGKEEGKPDGMKLSPEGHIYCTGPGGIWILSLEGVPLGRILLPERASNLAWGGEYGRTLYITASTSLYMIEIPSVSA
jgi:gluconolactonase